MSGNWPRAIQNVSKNKHRVEIAAILPPPKGLDRYPHSTHPNKQRGCSVKYRILFVGVMAASLVSPFAAQAQGVPDGVVHGVSVGNQTAGPIGAVVGGAVGGVIGGFEGALGIGPAAYPVPSQPVYRHPRRWRRHAYRYVRRKHAAG
jgi:hypothetical protein